ncbi:hypothetical protein PBY51_003091 [Eleginops maclovinus]|uniref:Uncharacterized protein n=1 Tax=Eleginops maclovinus TaxID=56733 RepID=A0AAN7XCP3_ELEMC|nr:hypothetical protein PBY51_003091 [Eleginops maclovinus]
MERQIDGFNSDPPPAVLLVPLNPQSCGGRTLPPSHPSSAPHITRVPPLPPSSHPSASLRERIPATKGQ